MVQSRRAQHSLRVLAATINGQRVTDAVRERMGDGCGFEKVWGPRDEREKTLN